MMEPFWSRMQVELLDTRRWKTRVELANAIFEYLEIFHNRRRRHSALGMLTPIQFEFEQHQHHKPGSLNPKTRLHRTGGTAAGSTEPRVDQIMFVGRSSAPGAAVTSKCCPRQPLDAAPRTPETAY